MVYFSDDEIKGVLSDFEKLNYKDNECFSVMVNSYRGKGKIPLFEYVMVTEQKKIMDTLDDTLPLKNQEEIRKKFGEYFFSRISEGMIYGKEHKLRLQSLEDRAEEVLSDFKKLNFSFKDNKCEDPSDDINYNDGWEADPFDKIAKYYGRKKDIFLFIYVVLSKQNEIIDIVNKKLISPDQKQLKDNFEKRLGRFLFRIEEGMNEAKCFLNNDDVIGFFSGCFWPCDKSGQAINHYGNLNIRLTENTKYLETSHLFTDKNERMKRNKHDVKMVKILDSNGKVIVRIKKVEEDQRNYCFTKFAKCDIEINWTVKTELGTEITSTVVFNKCSGEMCVKKLIIEGKDDERMDIFELSKQSGVLINNKHLHEILKECQSNSETVQKKSSKEDCSETVSKKQKLNFVKELKSGQEKIIF